MSSTRIALHAGSWYSGSRDVLSSQLDDWLSKADGTHMPARAIIAPHAGYSYSGPCAAFAYKQIDPSVVKRIFILGPSHHFFLPDCALSSQTCYETPLYNLDIDMDIYRELDQTGKFSRMNKETDEAEHSVEMHLPYIAKIMERRRGSYTIVPILVGALKPDKEAEYGHLLHKYLLDPNNLFVVSSDFCHWGKRFRYTYYNKEHGPIHASIEALDKLGMSKIEAMDPRGFSSYLQEYQNTICGRHPIVVLLHAIECARLKEATTTFDLRFLKYDQSNKCKHNSDSSVSYASASLVINSS